MHWYPDAFGWLATIVCCFSYFRTASALRRWQAVAAAIWIGYGVAIHSAPVIGANALVASFALLPPRWLPRSAHAGSPASSLAGGSLP
ncbi:MAG: hypothetical protein ACRD2E_10400 [Terriglobales bacterium]